MATTKKTAKTTKTVAETVAAAVETNLLETETPTVIDSPKKRRPYNYMPPRKDAPKCESNEMLVRDVTHRLSDCELETKTPLNDTDSVWVRGNKSAWKTILKARGANEKLRASFDSGSGVLRIG